MSGWYSTLSKQERRSFWACFSGWALDAMDGQIFSFILPVLIAQWALSPILAGYLGTANFLAAALGGWVCGILADRYGRVRVLQGTVLWFAAFTFLAGLAQTYPQMLTIRILQGFGLGGEWGAGAVLVGEMIRPKDRAKAVGSVQAGYGAGWTLAALLSALAFSRVQPDIAWRALLCVCSVPALSILFARRYMQESDAYVRTRASKLSRRHGAGWDAIFRPALLKTTALSALLSFGTIAPGVVLVVWLPTFMVKVVQLTPAGASMAMTVITLSSFAGFIGVAYISDHIGRRPTFLIFCSLAAGLSALYLFAPLAVWQRILVSVPLGFCTVGGTSTLGAYLTELFPTAVRGTGQAFAYNFGKAIAALSITAVGGLAVSHSFGAALALVVLGCYACAVLAVLLLPETKGATLRDNITERGRSAEPNVILPAADHQP
jgi:MFS family permease